MQQFNIGTFLEYRKTFTEHSLKKLSKTKRRRGSVHDLQPFTISDAADIDAVPVKFEAFKSMFANVWNGRTIDENATAAIYDKCPAIRISDSQLKVGWLADADRESRNAVRANLGSTMPLWQIHNKTLTVYCRSLDIIHYGILNLSVVVAVAHKLKCDRFNMVVTCPHVYTNANPKVGGVA